MTLVATQVKRRRGTGIENDAFTGAEGEITVDLTNKELRVHTGDNKVGGYGLARKDFENITDEAKNISNWSSNVSNCITNIPQDIKLEFDTTTKILTLKAGSKLYIPNGSGVFNEITISSDQTLTNTFSGQYNAIFVCWDSANNVMRQTPTVNSGTSDPSTANNRIWYDTTANKIKYYQNSGTTVTSDSLSFPICIMQNAGSGGGFTKIQQIFNGFGYIGSTVFLLPNVKVLIPNGRNTDGSLKTSLYSTNAVKIRITNPTYTGDFDYAINASLALDGRVPSEFHYDEQTNHFLDNSGNKLFFATIAKAHMTNGNIDSFTPKTVFHAVDYSDTEYIAHQAMPNNRRVSITAGASGTSYSAPADGYFEIVCGGSVRLENNTTGITITTAGTTLGGGCCFIPVSKGDIIRAQYTTSDYLNISFMYANGSK